MSRAHVAGGVWRLAGSRPGLQRRLLGHKRLQQPPTLLRRARDLQGCVCQQFLLTGFRVLDALEAGDGAVHVVADSLQARGSRL